MDLIGTNSYLRAEAKSHPIGHSSRGIPEDACGVDAGHELLSEGRGRSEDGVGVVGAVGVYVGDCFGDCGDCFDSQDEGEMLCVIVTFFSVL